MDNRDLPKEIVLPRKMTASVVSANAQKENKFIFKWERPQATIGVMTPAAGAEEVVDMDRWVKKMAAFDSEDHQSPITYLRFQPTLSLGFF